MKETDLNEPVEELARRTARLRPVLAGDGALLAIDWHREYASGFVLRVGSLPAILRDPRGEIAGIVGHGWIAAREDALALPTARAGRVRLAGTVPPTETGILASFLVACAPTAVSCSGRDVAALARTVAPRADIRADPVPSSINGFLARLAEAAAHVPGGHVVTGHGIASTDAATVAANIRKVLDWGVPPPAKGYGVTAAVGHAVFDPAGWEPPLDRPALDAGGLLQRLRRHVPRIAVDRRRARVGGRVWTFYALARFPVPGTEWDRFVGFPDDETAGDLRGDLPPPVRENLPCEHAESVFHGSLPEVHGCIAGKTLPFLFADIASTIAIGLPNLDRLFDLSLFALSLVHDAVPLGDGTLGVRWTRVPYDVTPVLAPKIATHLP